MAQEQQSKAAPKKRGDDRRVAVSPDYTGKDRRIGERRDFSTGDGDK